MYLNLTDSLPGNIFKGSGEAIFDFTGSNFVTHQGTLLYVAEPREPT